MGRIRVGLPGIPVRDDPERAVETLLALGFDACEIDVEGGFWMDYPWAQRLGEVARTADVALSFHAPRSTTSRTGKERCEPIRCARRSSASTARPP